MKKKSLSQCIGNWQTAKICPLNVVRASDAIVMEGIRLFTLRRIEEALVDRYSLGKSSSVRRCHNTLVDSRTNQFRVEIFSRFFHCRMYWEKGVMRKAFFVDTDMPVTENSLKTETHATNSPHVVKCLSPLTCPLIHAETYSSHTCYK